MLFSGVCTALVTPFDKFGRIDYKGLEKLLTYQIENGIKNLLFFGSTGEGSALKKSERENILLFAKDFLPKNITLIVGAGTNIPETSIEQINEAKKFGVSGCLVQTPYFNRCTQNGIVCHFNKICENVDMPIIVYNIPSRSGVNVEPKTMVELCKIKNIVGLKEANGNIDHILDMFHEVAGKLPIYCGNDNLNQIFANLHAAGTISVTSNVFPHEIIDMFEHGKSCDTLYNFNKLMFCEPNPIPVKYALSKLGVIQNNLRLPLTKLEKSHEWRVREELKRLGAI